MVLLLFMEQAIIIILGTIITIIRECIPMDLIIDITHTMVGRLGLVCPQEELMDGAVVMDMADMATDMVMVDIIMVVGGDLSDTEHLCMFHIITTTVLIAQ